MSWAVGYNEELKRDIGYGVPCICEHPDCNEEIDRGFAYLCGDPPYAQESGCGLYFCGDHKSYVSDSDVERAKSLIEKPLLEELLQFVSESHVSLCERCRLGLPAFDAKPDTSEWVHHKMTDPSWAEWRKINRKNSK